MAITDRDRFLKEKAIKYCLSSGLVPYLEVQVSNLKELSGTTTVLTDIDVLGLEVERSGRVRRTIFDCKTSKDSPINRSFWAAGLMRYTSCDEAFVLLARPALEAHKLSANSLQVRLLTESLFDSYAESVNIDYLNQTSYAASITNWCTYLDFSKGSNKVLIGLANYVDSQAPLERDCARSFRGILSKLKEFRRELDPTKPQHMSIYVATVASTCFVLASVVADIRNIFDPDFTKANFEELLRNYIWGGVDNFFLRQRIYEHLQQSTGGDFVSNYEIPEWDSFLELIRTFLDAPSHLSLCCIPLREISLRYMTNIVSDCDDAIVQRLCQTNRIRQFIFVASAYLVKASRLPKDFHNNLTEVINTLLTPSDTLI